MSPILLTSIEKLVLGQLLPEDLPDRIGTVRHMTDNTGTINNAIDYTGFGFIISETAPTIGDRFKFAQGELDQSIGWQLHDARWYAPDFGSFTSQDPERFNAGDYNLHRYAGNDPISMVDPLGLEGFTPNATWQRIKARDANVHDYLKHRDVTIAAAEIAGMKWFDTKFSHKIVWHEIQDDSHFLFVNPDVTAEDAAHYIIKYIRAGKRFQDWVASNEAAAARELQRKRAEMMPRSEIRATGVDAQVQALEARRKLMTEQGNAGLFWAEVILLPGGGFDQAMTIVAARNAPHGMRNEINATVRGAMPSSVPVATSVLAPSNVVVKQGKWDYFFGRVKSSPHNEARSLQNLKDLEALGIKEAQGGQAKLLKFFEEGKSLPEASRHVTQHGITITRTVEVPPHGAIDVKYFYPGGDLTATPEISSIIPKIFKK